MKASKRMAKMTPRELLMVFTATGRMVTAVNAEAGPLAPAKGERGVRRRARKARKAAHARRLQRVSWCKYHEAEKRARAGS